MSDQKRTSLGTRLLSMVLALSMAFALVPTSALAEMVDEVTQAVAAEEVTGEQTNEPDAEEASEEAMAEELVEEADPSEEVSESSSLADGSSAVSATAMTADEDATVSVILQVFDTDDSGAVSSTWADVSLEVTAGTTAAELTEQALDAAGVSYSVSTSWGWYLDSITSPEDGTAYSYDYETGKYWQLFYNGSYSSLGASEIALEDGDVISWYYNSDVTVTFALIGVDSDGNAETWIDEATYYLPNGATAAQLATQALDASGLEYDAYETSYGWYLDSITSADGTVYGYDESTWQYWQLYYNGSSAESGASYITLSSGDSVVLYYSAWGDELPENDVETDDAELPDYTSDWSGFANGLAGAVTTTVLTPTTSDEAELSWATQLKSSSDWYTYASDPIIVNGDVYVAVGSELWKIDAETGEVKATGTLATSINSVARMVYTDGMIVVPLATGRLQALNADTLATVWVTDALDGDDYNDQQSLSTLTVSDGYVYYGTALAGSSSSWGGYYLCVEVATGTVVWCIENDSCGYYWAGAATVGDLLVLGDDSGTLSAIDAATGEVVSTLALTSAKIRSTVVADDDGSTVYVVSYDGVLHKVSVAGDGTLTELASVSFAGQSTSTPTIYDGYAYVGGVTYSYDSSTYKMSYSDVLSVIDLSTMKVVHSISELDDGTALPGESKSTPLVSVQGDDVYVYFTCNGQPGGIYVYHLGDSTASLLYEPSSDLQQYCMASIVVGSDGSLYYINDSGYLMKIAGLGTISGGDDGETSGPSSSGSQTGGSTSTGSGSSSGSGSGSGTGTSSGSSSGSSTGSSAGSSSSGSSSRGTSATSGTSSRSGSKAGTSSAGTVTTTTADADDDDEVANDVEEEAEEASADAAEAISLDAEELTSDSADDEGGSYSNAIPLWTIMGLVVGIIVLVVAIWLILNNRRDGEAE